MMTCYDAKPCLIVVPCGATKVWAHNPPAGPTPARGADPGRLFRLHRAYAERFGDRWVVLNAKHGFVPPDDPIPDDSDVAFTRPGSGPVPIAVLRDQAIALELDRAACAVALGGAAYRAAVRAALEPRGGAVVEPFAGLPIGRLLQAVAHALETGESGFTREERP